MESPGGGQEASGLDELSTQPAPCHPAQCWGGSVNGPGPPAPAQPPGADPRVGVQGVPHLPRSSGVDRSRAPPRATLSTPSGPPALAGYLNKNFVGAGLLSSARPGRESLGNPQNGGRLQKLGCPPHPPRAPPQAHPARGGAGPGAPMGATAPPPGSLLPPCGVERKKTKTPRSEHPRLPGRDKSLGRWEARKCPPGGGGGGGRRLPGGQRAAGACPRRVPNR